MIRNAAVQELYRYLSGVADDASTMPVSNLSFAERVDAAGVIGEFIDRLEAARSDLLRAADAVAVDGERVSDRVFNDRRENPKTINAQVLQARVLDEYPILREGWRDGLVSTAQLRGILTGLDRLPVKLGPAKLVEAQQQLVAFCESLAPFELTKVA